MGDGEVPSPRCGQARYAGVRDLLGVGALDATAFFFLSVTSGNQSGTATPQPPSRQLVDGSAASADIHGRYKSALSFTASGVLV
jgi:hypothetical protein